LVKDPVPPMLPEKVRLLAATSVKADDPSVIVPAPLRLFTLWLKLFRSKVAPALMERLDESAIAFPMPACKVPLVMVVPPV